MKAEKDGDFHIRIKLDVGQSGFLNAKNMSDQHGDLVVESVCMHSVTQSEAVAACKGRASKSANFP